MILRILLRKNNDFSQEIFCENSHVSKKNQEKNTLKNFEDTCYFLEEKNSKNDEFLCTLQENKSDFLRKNSVNTYRKYLT